MVEYYRNTDTTGQSETNHREQLICYILLIKTASELHFQIVTRYTVNVTLPQYSISMSFYSTFSDEVFLELCVLLSLFILILYFIFVF